MNTKQQIWCLWCGPLFMAIFTLGLWFVAGFVPPTSPALSAEEIARFYQDNTTLIRLGQLIVIGCAGLMIPFVALIATQMRRIQGCSLALVYAQLGAGCTGVILFIELSHIWSVAAFRPDRDPELTRMLHDIGWIMFILPFTLALIQGVALGIAILCDKAARPVFPRWAGYFNFWVALLFVPGGIATFFKTGPFAWNGIFPFWIPLGVVGSWFVVMTVLLYQAIRREEREGALVRPRTLVAEAR